MCVYGMYVYVYAIACIQTCMYTQEYIVVCTPVYMYAYVCVCKYMYSGMNPHISMYVYSGIYTHMWYVWSMYGCVYVYIYIVKGPCGRTYSLVG